MAVGLTALVRECTVVEDKRFRADSVKREEGGVVGVVAEIVFEL